MRTLMLRHGSAAAWILGAAITLSVLGCAHPPGDALSSPVASQHSEIPMLQLAPLALGRELVEQQRLTVSDSSGRLTQLDVLLEVDSVVVQMAFVQLGQVLARLRWDGKTLDTTQTSWWPREVSPGRILSDLQFALWPLPAVQAALPVPWRMEQSGAERHLLHGKESVMVVRALAQHTLELDYLQTGWKLIIESTGSAGPGAAVHPDTHT